MKLLNLFDLGNIKSLKVKNSQLFFVSSILGKDALFEMNLSNHSIHLIYNPRFGADYPAISKNGTNIIFSDYTSNGFRLLKIKNTRLKKINSASKYNYQLADNLAKQESGVINFTNTDSIKYSSKKYKKVAHLFNFHSWAPVSIDVNSYNFSPGVSFMSQNKLGTSETILGYEWDISEKTGKVYAKYAYKGWFPIIDFEINSGKRASNYTLIETSLNNSNDTTTQRFTWNETNLNFDVRIPLNLSKGKYRRFLQPEIQYGYTFYGHDKSTPEKFVKGNSQSLVYRLYYSQFLYKSAQDVWPDFGIIADASFYHSPLGTTDLGTMLLGQSVLYLPGILANHGVRVYSGFQQKENDGVYSFSDAIRYPRGWGKVNTTEMSSFAFDYKLPLFYPEWSVGGLVYLKRITASLFADYANLKGYYYENGVASGTYSSTISSVGAELLGDMHFLRFYAPVQMGFRTSYLPQKNSVFFDFLLSIDFNSL